MRYFQISEPIMRDLMSAKSKVEDIKTLLYGPTFHPNGKEWREYLLQIINTTRYMPEDKEE